MRGLLAQAVCRLVRSRYPSIDLELLSTDRPRCRARRGIAPLEAGRTETVMRLDSLYVVINLHAAALSDAPVGDPIPFFKIGINDTSLSPS